jgi:hypothetical protein
MERFRHHQSLLIGNDIGFWHLHKIVHIIQELSVPWSVCGKGPATSIDILLNGALMLYWCIWPQFLVQGPLLAAQVLHWRHYFSTLFLAWSKWYLCQTVFRVLLTPKWPPDGPPCSFISTLFTLLWGRIIWAIFDQPSVDSQWHSSMLFLTVRDFHWAQYLSYVGHSWWCHSILGAVQSLFPPEWAMFWSFNWCHKCDWINWSNGMNFWTEDCSR